MADPIEPALTPEEWASLAASEFRAEWLKQTTDTLGQVGTIAALNHLLPDSDPRKITREKINALSSFVGFVAIEAKRPLTTNERERAARAAALFQELEEALESYLPPEG